MRILPNFKLADVPLYKVLFAVTSEPDYEMSRILIVEDYPDYDDYAVVEGHCSCYNWDETAWDATIYTKDELLKVLTNWLGRGTYIKQRIVQLWALSGHRLG